MFTMMRRKYGSVIIVTLVLIIASFAFFPRLWIDPFTESPVSDEDGNYHYKIVASQWTYQAFNLIELEKLQAKDPSIILWDIAKTRSIGPFTKGSQITMELFSADIVHGFKIDEVGITKRTSRPEPGQGLGQPTIFSFIFPNEDTTFIAYTHIFVGLGTDDMKLQFIVGDPIIVNLSLQFDIFLMYYTGYFIAIVTIFYLLQQDNYIENDRMPLQT